jgi:PAS domain S-box-containing protein
MVVTDVTTDPAFDAAERAAWIAGGVRAAITVALVKGGRFVADFGVQSAGPRAWTADEVALVEETAERTWAAVERARTEASLRESEAKYRTLFESINQGFYIAEAVQDAAGKVVDFRHLEANGAIRRMTGLDVIGRRVSEVVPNLEDHWLEPFDRVVRTGEPMRIENYNAATGRWYQAHYARIGGPGSRLVGVTVDDTTERRQAEAALKESEERQAFLLKLSDTLRAAPDAHSIKEQTVRMLGEHLHADRCYISEVFEEQGFSTVGPEHLRPGVPPMSGTFRLADYPETMRQLATQPMVVCDADNDPRFSESEKALLAGLNLRSLLVVALRKGEGHVIWALAAAIATPRQWTNSERLLLEETAERAWAAVERAKAEEALRESEAKFRTLSETAPALIWYNDANGENRFINQQFLDYTGMTAEEIRGTGWHSLVHPDEREAYIADYLAAVREQRAWRAQNRIRRYDGAWRWFYNHARPLFAAEGGAYLGHVGVTIDITERKEAEERKAFLLRLSDALRPLGDPERVQAAATGLLREHLSAGWCYYVEWDEADKVGVVLRDSVREGLPSLAGVHDVSDVPEFLDYLRSGQALNVSDYANYGFLSERVRGRYVALGFRSMIGTPLVKDGRLLALLLVGDTETREWPEEAVALVAEVAERTWAAVERAKAEEALRESEEKYRTLFDSIDEGFCLIELMYDERGEAVDYRFLDVNRVFERQTGLVGAAGKRVMEIAPQTESYWVKAYEAVARTGEPVRFENHTEHNNSWYQVYASRVGGEGSRQIAIVFDDITVRKERERQQEYLLQLSDALRPLSEASEIQRAAIRVLGEHLGVDRVYYVNIEPDYEHWVVADNYVREGVPPLIGRGRVDDFGWAGKELFAGRMLRISDVDKDPNLSESARGVPGGKLGGFAGSSAH